MLVDNNDTVNKIYNSCGCIISSKFDICHNQLIDDYIQVCKNHYLSLSSSNKLFYKSKSYNNLKSLNKPNNKKIRRTKSETYLDDDISKYDIINFGKYKFKSFDFIYNMDKFYCYKLMQSKLNNNLYDNNSNIYKFIKYIELMNNDKY